MTTRVWARVLALCGAGWVCGAILGSPGSAVDAAPRAAPAVPSQELANVAALARAAAVVRYLHPSDQAAALDWDAFLPAAIDRVRDARDPAALLAALRGVFAPIAPTAVFSLAGGPQPSAIPPRGDGSHLARWRRYGLASPSPYAGFREGRDNEDNAPVSVEIPVRIADPGRCGAARVNAIIRRTEPLGAVTLLLHRLLPGQADSTYPWPVPDDGHIEFSVEIAPEIQALELGVQVDHRAGATIESLAVSCSNGASVAIDPTARAWHVVGPSDLYTWRTGRCGAVRCASFARRPLDRSFVAERDLLAADLGAGIHLDLPLAVWSDGARTLPVPNAWPSAWPTADARTVGLAAVAAAWGALSLFYPYLQDQRIEWSAALVPALAEAAAARTQDERRIALGHMLAELHDGHIRLTGRDMPEVGVLPIATRRFGDTIAVVGGATGFMLDIGLGSEVIAIDGVPARTAYDRAATSAPAGTDGLRAHLAGRTLGNGPLGEVRQVELRNPDGTRVVRALPLVKRSSFDHSVRQPRPWTGTEVEPGVIYVDFDGIAVETFSAQIPTLTQARALIFDFRGYTTSGLAAMSHLLRGPAEQLTWQVPQLPARGRAAWAQAARTQYPISPRLTAPVIALIDGQAASMVETTLALLRDYKLGALIGETTSGTSGLISTFTVPGDYTIRYTAVRLVQRNGQVLHGRGIVPDQIVHPTLDGIRAGRDEILEAGIAAARRLARGAPARATP